ncbi:MAG: PEPxxWA-CTERM sorting domain-containing protein [Sphingomonadaceae bacterium]
MALAPAQAAQDFTANLVSVVASGPGSWSYSVGGWGGGGIVSGIFTGTDLDLDGQLSSFAGEVTGFTMSYSSGSIEAPFSLSFADLYGLVYDLDGGSLGDGTTLAVEGIGALGSGTGFIIGPGPYAVCGTGQTCGVIEGPAAGAIPEPMSWVMLIAGFGLVGGVLRGRQPVTA